MAVVSALQVSQQILKLEELARFVQFKYESVAAVIMGERTGPVQVSFPFWTLHSGWQGKHSPDCEANSRLSL